MRHRHWFLVAAGLMLLIGFVLIRIDVIISVFPTYGGNDIEATSRLAIAFVLAWLVLEVTHQVTKRRVECRGCGYRLEALKCPECGEAIGGPRPPRPPPPPAPPPR
jgi:hypothetical protein